MKKLIVAVVFLMTYSAFGYESSFVFTNGERSAFDLARDKVSKGAQVVELAHIKPGMTILDVFGGGGYYSEILSKKVGDSGRVYLHNNKAYMPWVEKELVARLRNSRLKNVIRFDREADNLTLKPQQFDAVFHVLGYHDLYHKADGWNIDKDGFLDQLLPSIKQGGQLVIVDHSAVKGSNTKYCQELHRIDKDYVIDEITQRGFHLMVQSDLLANKDDDRLTSPFLPAMRRKTDRFILVFEKN